MELKDTVGLMLSDKFEDRLIAEYLQAKIRYEKLSEVLEAIKIGSDLAPSVEDARILLIQLASIGAYVETLKFRTERIGIDLPEVAI